RASTLELRPQTALMDPPGKVAEPALDEAGLTEMEEAPVPEVADAAHAVEEEAVPAVEEDAAPAEVAGYLVEVPLPAGPELPSMAMVSPQPDFEKPPAPSVPLMTDHYTPHQEMHLAQAGRVVLVRGTRVADSIPAPRERSLEVREFVRPLPIVQIR